MRLEEITISQEIWNFVLSTIEIIWYPDVRLNMLQYKIRAIVDTDIVVYS